MGDTLYDKAMATRAPGWLQVAGEAVYNALPKGKKKKKKKMDFSKVDKSRADKIAKMNQMKSGNALAAKAAGVNDGSI